MFAEEFDRFLLEQRRLADGRRLEMLQGDLTGTRKMLEVAIWPVLRSFEGLILEHEMVTATGVRIYGDVYCKALETVFESEGFVAHAENITRERFTFERLRVRSMMNYGYKYVPFSWDELDKKGDACRRSVYELLGRFGLRSAAGDKLTLIENEVIRCALLLNRPFRVADICMGLSIGTNACRRTLRKLMMKNIVRPLDEEKERIHTFVLRDDARSHLNV